MTNPTTNPRPSIPTNERAIGAVADALYSASWQVNVDLQEIADYKDTQSIVGGIMGVKEELVRMIAVCDAAVALQNSMRRA